MEGEVCRDQVCLDSEAETQYLQVNQNIVENGNISGWYLAMGSYKTKHVEVVSHIFVHGDFNGIRLDIYALSTVLPAMYETQNYFFTESIFCRTSAKCCPTWYYQRLNLAQVMITIILFLNSQYHNMIPGPVRCLIREILVGSLIKPGLGNIVFPLFVIFFLLREFELF